MDLLIQTCLFLWIAVGFLSIAYEPCKDNEDGTKYSGVVAQEHKTWSQARSACTKRGGELLKVMNCPVKKLLRNLTKERNKDDHTWWVGEGVLGEDQGSTLELDSTTGDGGDSSPSLCTYLKLDPLQLVTTSNCSERRGYLCTLDLKLSPEAKDAGVSGHATLTRTRSAREVNASNIEMVLQEADTELLRMETTVGEPTDKSRDNFIKTLLEGVEKLTTDYVLQNNGTVPHIINCTGGILLLSMRRCNAETPKSFFEKVSELYQVVGLLWGTAVNEPVVIKHPTGTIYQTSLTPADMDKKVLGSEEDGAYIKLPSFSALQPQLVQYTTINTQLTTFSENPHPSEENITGTICSLVFLNGSSEIQLHNLTEIFEIFLHRSGTPPLSNSTIEVNDSRPIVNAVNISDPNATVIFNVEPSYKVLLLVLLSPRSPPNETYYSSRTILNHTGGYRWMVTPEMLQQTTGVWYVRTSLFNTTLRPGLSLVFTFYSSKCMYWDTTMEIWSITGCFVGEQTTPERTQCLCNHLTLFGSSFFVMPNYVDLSRTAEYFSRVSENYVVVVLLSAFFGLYLVTLIWACYADRRALSRRKMTLLEDSHPCAKYNYLLNIQTGHRKNAGTSANVTVKLIGTEGETEIQTLTDPDKPVFERKAADMFLLATPFPLGELQNIRLQHDNSGGHPSWYVNKVTVQDLQTRQVWHFLCDSWLSAERGEGLTKKNFSAAKNNEIASFRNIFQSRTSTGFRDEHIWVSVVDPPWRSPFTRAQRISCCMSLLLCTMAINIAFWNIPKDADSQVILSIGFVKITWQEVMVGVESGLLMFPINILIITIFRSIKPRLSSKAQKNSPRQDMKPCAVTIPTILKETEELVNTLSGSPRNQVQELKERLVSASDLCPALDSVHGLIQLMQGESESGPHWVHCSQFVLSCLSHLSLCLERLDVRAFPSQEEHQQAINMTDLLLRKAEMVFTSHMAYCPRPVCKKSVTSGCLLPWWCVFLGWFLLLSISGVSTFFTLLYGFQYGKQKAIQWVISLGLSLFQSIFILQPLKVVGLAIIFALLMKPVAVEESDEVDEVLLEQQDKCRLYSGRDTH